MASGRSPRGLVGPGKKNGIPKIGGKKQRARLRGLDGVACEGTSKTTTTAKIRKPPESKRRLLHILPLSHSHSVLYVKLSPFFLGGYPPRFPRQDDFDLSLELLRGHGMGTSRDKKVRAWGYMTRRLWELCRTIWSEERTGRVLLQTKNRDAPVQLFKVLAGEM